jgi:cAMP-dependent protein kinase regulator
MARTRTLANLWSEVIQAFEREQWDRALKRCIVILQGAPDCFEARMMVADILLKQGMVSEAMEVYKVIAWHFTKAGFPLLGIVAIKMLTAVEQSYAEVLEVLAGLYSADSDRVSPEAPAPKLPDLKSVEITKAAENIDSVVPLAGRELGSLATKLATDEKGLTDYPEKLHAIPLFSDLPEDAFAKLLGDLQLRRFVRDSTILREGDPGKSFFLLARGMVEVSKQVSGENLVLARLYDGSVFGEMALVSSEPRSATVRARSQVDLLELARSDLEKEAEQLESVGRALKKFTRSRMLSNLMALSHVFRALPHEERHAVLDRFISMTVKKGQVIIEEGRKGIGLFVVLRGEAEVKKREGRMLVPLALLRAGDVFGEISLIKDIPTTATVIAGKDGEFLFLSRREFESRVRRNPELWRTLSDISEERLRETARLMSETELLGDDELILI